MSDAVAPSQQPLAASQVGALTEHPGVALAQYAQTARARALTAQPRAPCLAVWHSSSLEAIGCEAGVIEGDSLPARSPSVSLGARARAYPHTLCGLRGEGPPLQAAPRPVTACRTGRTHCPPRRADTGVAPPLSAPYRAATRASGTQSPWRVGVIAESASLDQLVCLIWLSVQQRAVQPDEAEGLLMERGRGRGGRGLKLVEHLRGGGLAQALEDGPLSCSRLNARALLLRACEPEGG